MNLKKFNLYQTSEGMLQGYCIGTIWATSFQMVGNTAMFSLGDTCIAAMNFVRVEVDFSYET